MSSAHWPRVKRVFKAALDLGPAERAELIERESAGDADVRREVESLLASLERAPNAFLEEPPPAQPEAGATRSLADLISELGAVPEPLLREIALEVARGLSELHARGVAHGGLRATSVALTDGTLVTLASDGAAGAEPPDDVLALGLVLHEAATGERISARELTRSLGTEAPGAGVPRLSARAPEVTPFLDELVAWMLAPEPAERPSSAEVAALLAQGESSSWWASRRSDLFD